jgi:hypothetical protein
MALPGAYRETMTILVVLLDEGTCCARPTECIDLGDGLFQLLATPGYSPENEHWEFPPGSVVRGKKVEDGNGENYILAVQRGLVV